MTRRAPFRRERDGARLADARTAAACMELARELHAEADIIDGKVRRARERFREQAQPLDRAWEIAAVTAASIKRKIAGQAQEKADRLGGGGASHAGEVGR